MNVCLIAGEKRKAHGGKSYRFLFQINHFLRDFQKSLKNGLFEVLGMNFELIRKTLQGRFAHLLLLIFLEVLHKKAFFGLVLKFNLLSGRALHS